MKSFSRERVSTGCLGPNRELSIGARGVLEVASSTIKFEVD